MQIPLVLLPGLLSDNHLWQHQCQQLIDIAPIQVIFSTQDSPYKMVEEILIKAPKKFVLAGHSMGGWLSLEIMRSAPERVEKLCLINTTARMDSEEKRMKRHKMIERVLKGHFNEVISDIVELFVFNEIVKDQVRNMFLKVGEEVFIQQQKSMMMRAETISILQTITCPTLVIHAAQDKVFSLDEHRELVRKIKNAQLVTVENSGHMSPMEVPEQITYLLQSWLRNT